MKSEDLSVFVLFLIFIIIIIIKVVRWNRKTFLFSFCFLFLLFSFLYRLDWFRDISFVFQPISFKLGR